MKLFGFLILSILLHFGANCQMQSDTFACLKLKKGIYFSFIEIQTQNPSFFGPLIIIERKNSVLKMKGGGKYTFDSHVMSKAVLKKTKKYFVGISDGDNFFISDRFTIGSGQGMMPCLLTGPYLVAPVRGNAGQYTGGGLIPSLINVRQTALINLNTGHSEIISQEVLRKLLLKYPKTAHKYARVENLLDFSISIIDDINNELVGN